MNTCYSGRSSRPVGLFSFGLLDGPQVRLRRPHLCEKPTGKGASWLRRERSAERRAWGGLVRKRGLRSQPLRDGIHE
jgi:hypothetical protein